MALRAGRFDQHQREAPKHLLSETLCKLGETLCPLDCLLAFATIPAVLYRPGTKRETNQ